MRERKALDSVCQEDGELMEDGGETLACPAVHVGEGADEGEVGVQQDAVQGERHAEVHANQMHTCIQEAYWGKGTI